MKKDLFEAMLAKLTPASEMYAIFGRGFPHSFYKVYVRPTPKDKWWRIKQNGYPVRYDPHKDAMTYPANSRLGALVGPIGYFLLYEDIGHDGLKRFRARVVEVCGAHPHKLVLTPAVTT